ncbi:MAG: lipopolysaccharide heptosyltransferase I [Chlamydiota bacterium]
MRVLFIKLTSMGDVIHALAALSDAFQHVPGLIVDWVVDENFQEIPKMHPAVRQIITTNHRNWRKSPWAALRPVYSFLKELRGARYDFVIDGQTNWKSALIARLAKGTTVGLDRFSAREYVAHFAYDIKHHVSRKQHAVAHLREFFSQVFDYPLQDTPPNFGIQLPPRFPTEASLPPEYYVLVHAASWETKLWPEETFSDLISHLDLPVLLVWGSKSEQKRAQNIAQGHAHAHVLPKMGLMRTAQVLQGAKAVVSVDTGLGHLSAALGVPTLGVHGPTDPKRVGSIGPKSAHVQPSIACFPCHKSRCYYQGKRRGAPHCLQKISAEVVLDALNNLLD